MMANPSSASPRRHPKKGSSFPRIPTAAARMLPLLPLLLLSPAPPAMAFPTAAGGCSGSRGSVGGSHLDPPDLGANFTYIEEEAPLAKMRLAVSYDRPGDGAGTRGLLMSSTVVEAGAPYTLYLGGYPMANNTGTAPVPDKKFKGFLFRFAAVADAAGGAPSPEQADTSGSLSVVDGDVGDGAQLAAACAGLGIGGVCHSDGRSKGTAAALLVEPVPGRYDLQVTAVFENEVEAAGKYESEWAWSSYVVLVVE